MRRRAVVLATVSALIIAGSLEAQERASASLELGGGTITVSYSVPSARGRGPKDVPAGTAWRMGAGDSALLKTDVPLLIGDLVVSPGEHRLATRHVEEGRWNLIVFHGGALFDEGLPRRETPVRFAEHEESQEELRITLAKDEGVGRFDLRFGTFGLSAQFHALPLSRVETELGGQKTTLEFYGLPAQPPVQDKVAGGVELTVGTARLGGEGGATLTITGQVIAGVPTLVFRNEGLQDLKKMLASAQRRKERLEGRLKQIEDEERRAMFERMLEESNDNVAKLEARLKEAEALPEKVSIGGAVQQEPTRADHLSASSEAGDGEPVVRIRYGLKSASYRIDPKSFRRSK